ncbi:hypothetical protein EI94DRAFT_989998 [Lactarius quietus]|nr:hypothetical protein EI94DRAFT_989998 [Lactarius quietus]
MYRRLRPLVGPVSIVNWPFGSVLVGWCPIKAHVSLRFSLLSPFAKSLMPSIQSVHVHFPALLEQPPVDRVRKRGLVYPKLAQSKGSGDRMLSPDLFWGSRQVSAATSEPKSKDAAPRRRIQIYSKPALPETGFFAFARARKCFNWLTGGKPSSDYAPSSSSSQFLGFGFGPLHARRCNAPVIEDGRPFVPSSRPVFLVSTPVSSYSSGTSASSRGWGNSSVSVAFSTGA